MTECLKNESSDQDIKPYKFQGLRVYQLALDYVDSIYKMSKLLPQNETYNMRSQLERAATSIALNIAEGSTGQSDLEQARFLAIAMRSYLETVACMDMIERHSYLSAKALRETRQLGHRIFVKLQAMRNKLRNGGN